MKEKIFFYYKQPNQLNDIIRKLHVVIDFVNSTGCSKDTKIIDYAVNVLKISNIEELNSNELKVSFFYNMILSNFILLIEFLFLKDERARNDIFTFSLEFIEF